VGFVRFVVHEKDPDSTVRSGVFQAIIKLLKSGELSGEEAARLRALKDWFDEHLPEPNRFSRKRNPSPGSNKGVSWFKDSAQEHLSRLHQAVTILQAHGVSVEMLTTNRPGYVLFEDEHQIVAQPFARTPR
jgi:hypothetical protein